ncbi:hypothetical protein EUGRSUZ_B02100 [Eucalyptus grandis]|uniref:Uncharacterized protein n=2 Tax=Eucalyptus grandis TaxID=71139 RepID=A0ACC3LT51_EUCGR|nr:hypothetical protein EUGRSUZ_B02100 [Eucalyptus grandis]
MEVTSSKRMGSPMFVAALLLWSAIGAKADQSAKCISLCTLLCASDPVPNECIQTCLKGCLGQSSSSVASGLCNVGCFLSTCSDRHPGNNLCIKI